MVTHPNINPVRPGLTSVNICLGRLSEACNYKEVARELENDHHISLEANVSPFPFIFFNHSGFSILLVTTSSQGAIYLRHLPWHDNDIWYQNNIVYY